MPETRTFPIVQGYLPTSLSDWDQQLAQVLFLPGCNFRCPFCHNAGIVRGEGEPFAWRDIIAAMDRHQGWVRATVITGGEPTLQAGLLPLCRWLKGRGHRIKLDTNGARPDILRAVLAEHAVDYVAMDVKTSWTRYPEATGMPDAAARVRESFAVLRDSGLPFELRTTVVLGLVAAAELDELIPTLDGAPRWYLQAYRPAPTLDPAWSELTPPLAGEVTALAVKLIRAGFAAAIRNQ
ncbi:MAG TPA: anaerobic ribonucleoside-triphosphate reductase activating protein [bacterium]|nr:anaerobic ribonucleoside-triphosphate reductase activating protein [bacterium]